MGQALLRQGVDTSKTKFLQDNARSHIAKITQHKIEELVWELPSYPPYSPDLASSDYHLFRSKERFLEDKKNPKTSIFGYLTTSTCDLPTSSRMTFILCMIDGEVIHANGDILWIELLYNCFYK